MATTLSRTELQQLAKQHGIKANMKNAEIEAALMDKGALPGAEVIAPAKKKGLSVRDPNAQAAAEEEAKIGKTGKDKVKKVATVVVQVDQSSQPASADMQPVANENVLASFASAKGSRKSSTAKIAATQEDDDNQQQETVAPVPADLPLGPRRLRMSSTTTDENVVSGPAADEDLPLAQRRPRRSSSLSNGSSESASQASAAGVEPSSRTRRSSRAKDESSLAVEGSTADLEDVPVATTTTTTAPNEYEVAVAKPKAIRISNANRYVSRKKTEQRETVKAELEKEMKEMSSSEKEESSTPPPTKTEEQTTKRFVAETPPAIVSMEEATVVAATPNAAAARNASKTPVVVSVAAVTVAANEEQGTQAEPKQRSIGKPMRVIVRKSVSVPDVPPTPEIATGERSNEQQQQEHVPVAPQQQDETAKPSSSSSAMPPKRTIRKINVPFLPPTPECVQVEREKASKRLANVNMNIDEMRRKFKGAAEAVDMAHASLVEQKRLMAENEILREENKRYRAMLALDE